MIVNQPHDDPLGIHLIKEIESDQYTQLTIMVAYAKLSGVYRISPYLEKFHGKGGVIRCVVGIDQQNTTYDALSHLLKITNNIYIFHSESVSQTFHIKCFWLSGNKKCWYAIGSNNLTAGGLFSNYEMSTLTSLSGKSAAEANCKLEEIYATYTDSASVCSRKLDVEFLEELISDGYIVKEMQQRQLLADLAKRAHGTERKDKLFGNEVFSAPSLPEQYRKKKGRKTTVRSENRHSVPVQVVPAETKIAESSYLIRLVPRAGNRSKQVHFTVDLLEKYFCLSAGDGILVQEMHADGKVGEIEHRQIVFSQRNHNVKIELEGASMLDTSYPSDHETRPVLIIKRVNANLFVYMILLDGDEGYTALNARLKALPNGKSLPSEVIDESTMASLWADCPIV